jgi:1-acyl-sn-glycerol-3-phosphate acyltransferase
MPKVSPALIKWFAAYSRGYVRRRFHSMRIFKYGLPPHDRALPLVIYLNHAAWWDPLVCLLLAREFFPERFSFAPIEEAMLERYAFFRKLGFFGIAPGTSRGAFTLLRTAQELLVEPSNALWLTPQGGFTDVRERPVHLQKGLGILAARHPGVAFVPLAIEYAFWTEPRPEILVGFGAPIFSLETRSPAAWTRVFSAALQEAQDELAVRSARRDPDDWLTLSRGQTGIAGIYDLWRWLCAKWRGKQFVTEHSWRSKA